MNKVWNFVIIASNKKVSDKPEIDLKRAHVNNGRVPQLILFSFPFSLAVVLIFWTALGPGRFTVAEINQREVYKNYLKGQGRDSRAVNLCTCNIYRYWASFLFLFRIGSYRTMKFSTFKFLVWRSSLASKPLPSFLSSYSEGSPNFNQGTIAIASLAIRNQYLFLV